MYGQSYEYLRITPFIAKTIQHASEYVKKGEKQEATRKIFKGVGYDRFESKAIQDLIQILKSKKIQINNQAQSNEVLLRFLYANEFDNEKTMMSMAKHILWLDNESQLKLDEPVMKLFRLGIIYLGGRDKQYRPTLVINVHKINPDQMPFELILQALNVMCILMEDYMFYEGKVENWNIILDTADRCLVDFPINSLQAILDSLQKNFPQCVDRIFIVQPSLSLNLSWNLLESFLGRETKKKVTFVRNKDFTMLRRIFEPDQLEKKFGGKMDDLVKYWPPFNTLQNGLCILLVFISSEYIEELIITKEVGSEQMIEINHQITDNQKTSIKQSVKEQQVFQEFTAYHQNHDHDQIHGEFASRMIPTTVEPYNSMQSYIPEKTSIKSEDNGAINCGLSGNFGNNGHNQQTVKSMAFGSNSQFENNNERQTQQQQQFDPSQSQVKQISQYQSRRQTSANHLLQSKQIDESRSDDPEQNYQACLIF